MSHEEEPLDDNAEAPEEPAEIEEAQPPELGEAAVAEVHDFQIDVTQLYLNDIGQSALLTPEQEVALARRTRDGTSRRGRK